MAARWGPRVYGEAPVKQADRIVRRPSSVADFEEGAGDCPHHVPQEPVAAQLELHNPFVLRQLQSGVSRRPDPKIDAGHGPDGARHGAAGRLERGEIVCADQAPGGRAHGRQVEWRRDEPVRPRRGGGPGG